MSTTLEAVRPVAVPFHGTKLPVCHVMTADLWAGAEVQLATTFRYLVADSGLSMSAVLFNDGPLAAALRRFGIPVSVLDESKIASATIVLSLARFLQAHAVQIVHTHRYKDTVLGAAAAHLAGVPYLMRTIHGLREPARGWARWKAAAYDSVERTTLRASADRIVAVSNQLATHLRSDGFPAALVSSIPNGVDVADIVANTPAHIVKRRLGLDENAEVVGTAGRLVPVKGHEVLLRAARSILHQRPHTRFVIVGDGELATGLPQLAERLGVRHACVFPGNRRDVFDVIAAMDVFTLPSWHEGMPMALLEAMALRRPTVATNVGGVSEVIQHGDNGWLVPPGDERGLANACVTLLADRHLAARLGERARRHITSRCSAAANARALSDEYRRLAVTPRRRRSLAARIASTGWRRLAGSLTRHRERQRMLRIQGHPAALQHALAAARIILIVCHGNIIRSPIAECLLRRAANSRRDLTIVSAGLEATAGHSAHPAAVAVASEHGLDLAQHRATRVGPDSIDAADVIFVMDLQQAITLRHRYPWAGHKLYLLTCLAPDTPLEVRDPVLGARSDFCQCVTHLVNATRPIGRVLQER